jgi:putative membrane protein
MTISVRYAALVLLLALPACAPEREEPADTGGAEAAAPSPSPAAAPALSDPQIAHIAVTANTIDVEAGRLAESRAVRAEVQDFARTMVTDHSAVNEQASALAQRLGVVPEDNEVSRSLQADAAEARVELEGLSGEAFDSAYVEREVAFHQTVLDALDQTLIPSSTNEELRGLLEQVRPAIAAHLEHARSLQSSSTAPR